MGGIYLAAVDDSFYLHSSEGLSPSSRLEADPGPAPHATPQPRDTHGTQPQEPLPLHTTAPFVALWPHPTQGWDSYTQLAVAPQQPLVPC